MTGQKTAIGIGLPTLNEVGTIRQVTALADAGLSCLGGGLIMNIDGGSADGTREAFLATPTSSEKLALLDRGHGKGSGIAGLMRKAVELDLDILCLFDTDTKTFSSSWISQMAGPIASGRSDFVAPAYTRNMFEANTTNHFCYPLVKALCGRPVSQPIGGEFAMSGAFIERAMGSMEMLEASGYGADISLTLCALSNGFRIEEAVLGRKIHKPSFGKMAPMFVDVAATALYLVSRDFGGTRPPARQGVRALRRIDGLAVKPAHGEIAGLKALAAQLLREAPRDTVQAELGGRPAVHAGQWATILSEAIARATGMLPDPAASRRAAGELLPFFLLRVLTYFDEVEELGRDCLEVERLIEDQAVAVADRFEIAAARAGGRYKYHFTLNNVSGKSHTLQRRDESEPQK